MPNEFENQSKLKSTGLLAELLGFMRDHKKWWLLPILIVTLLLVLIVTIGGSGAAPLIYTLF